MLIFNVFADFSFFPSFVIFAAQVQNIRSDDVLRLGRLGRFIFIGFGRFLIDSRIFSDLSGHFAALVDNLCAEDVLRLERLGRFAFY